MLSGRIGGQHPTGRLRTTHPTLILPFPAVLSIIAPVGETKQYRYGCVATRCPVLSTPLSCAVDLPVLAPPRGPGAGRTGRQEDRAIHRLTAPQSTKRGTGEIARPRSFEIPKRDCQLVTSCGILKRGYSLATWRPFTEAHQQTERRRYHEPEDQRCYCGSGVWG